VEFKNAHDNLPFFMQIEVCPEVSEFLSFLKIGTRNVYSRGLTAFARAFYLSNGSIKDFLDRLKHDRLLPRGERRRVDRFTLNGFVVWLQDRGYSPKTVRIYVGGVQSF